MYRCRFGLVHLEVALDQVGQAYLAVDGSHALGGKLFVELADDLVGRLVQATHYYLDFIFTDKFVVAYRSSFANTRFTTI